MNRRETLAMYRVAVMRQRLHRATAQRQAAEAAQKLALNNGTTPAAADCTCPACMLTRSRERLQTMMVKALTEGVAGVSIQAIDLSPPDGRDDGTTKH